MERNLTSKRAAIVVAAILFIVGSRSSGAQPFGAWAVFNGTNGYIEIPHSAALNPTDALTIEAWVNVTLPPAGENCKSIIGKNWQQTYWVGICNSGSPATPTLRSYVKGSASSRTAGVVPNGEWTHIAVVYGGGFRRHYINGELALVADDDGSLPTNSRPVRIGSDEAWAFTPTGSIDDVRFWDVARTQAQIREALNEVQGAQPGFVANWRLDGSPVDAVGPHDGTAVGAVSALTFPVAVGCTGSSEVLCLRNRFAIRGNWRKPDLTEGPLGVVPYQTFDSGLLHFFGPSIWEIQIKVLDACGLNDRYWVYFGATTDLFFRMEVFDQLRGVQKIYFNYPGAPAPAVTESSAFDTCP
jgi:hypothetical protein